MTDQTNNKLDLATEQLDDAISLFLEEQFVSALVLAGAAEEIFGKALSDSGKPSDTLDLEDAVDDRSCVREL